MVLCLTGARFNMKADILRQGVDDPTTPDTDEGSWETRSDPDSGEIIRVWVPNTPDDASTPENEAAGLVPFNCLARGLVGQGSSMTTGTNKDIGELYSVSDYVRIWFPAGTPISRNDRVTNIRDPRGNVIWVEEERGDRAPTVFNVLGVTPIPDPFGRHTQSVALLERIEGQ